MSVEASPVSAKARRLEELTIRRRGNAGAEDRRQRFPLLLVDQTP
jgi:hypothetical protein